MKGELIGKSLGELQAVLDTKEARSDGLYKAALYSNGRLITEGPVEASSKSAANEKAWNDWGKKRAEGKSGIEFKITELGNPKEAGDSKKAKELSDKLEDLGDYSSYKKTDSPDLPYLYNADQQIYMDSRLNAWRVDKSEDPARKHNKRAFRMIAKEPMARVWVEGNDVHAESGFTPQTARVSFSSKEEAEKFASRFK